MWGKIKGPLEYLSTSQKHRREYVDGRWLRHTYVINTAVTIGSSICIICCSKVASIFKATIDVHVYHANTLCMYGHIPVKQWLSSWRIDVVKRTTP